MNLRRAGLATQISALIAAVVLLALLVFRFAVYESPRASARQATSAPSAPQPQPMQAVVLSVEGEVESGREGGEWAALRPGEQVRADSLLRTGANGRTDLAVGQRSRVTIGESSEVAVRELTGSVHRFRLTRGRMTADYQPEGERVLRVEDGNGETVAEAKAARFGVLSTGTGIAVATTSGAVELHGRQQTVYLAAGEQSFVPQGAAPLPPTAIPTDVLLKVANALAEGTDAICAEIDGEAAPGSEITIDGVAVAPGPDGHFREQVARKPKKTGVLVAIRDPSGREKSSTIPCSPRPAQIHGMNIRWKTR